MSHAQEFNIKGAAETTDLSQQSPAKSADQPEKPIENADSAEKVEEVSPDTLTIWGLDQGWLSSGRYADSCDRLPPSGCDKDTFPFRFWGCPFCGRATTVNTCFVA